jgi:hypothetical protein
MHDAFATLVRLLGLELGIDELPVDDDHGTQLVVDSNHIVNLRLNPQNGSIVLFANLGEADGPQAPLMFQRALQANLFARGTLGAVIGFNPPNQQLILSRELSLEHLELPAFLPVLENFITAMESLSTALRLPDDEISLNGPSESQSWDGHFIRA